MVLLFRNQEPVRVSPICSIFEKLERIKSKTSPYCQSCCISKLRLPKTFGQSITSKLQSFTRKVMSGEGERNLTPLRYSASLHQQLLKEIHDRIFHERLEMSRFRSKKSFLRPFSEPISHLELYSKSG